MNLINVVKRVSLAGLVVASPMSLANTTAADLYGPAKGTDVQTLVLMAGEDYELKQLSYTDGRGIPQQSDFYFLYSAQGANNAYLYAGLPLSERNDIVSEFEGSSPTPCGKAQEPCLPDPQAATADDEFDVIVVDRDAANANTFSKMEALVDKRGWGGIQQEQYRSLKIEGADLGKADYAAKGCFGWNHRSKNWQKSFNETFNKSKRFGSGNAFVEVEINATTAGSGKATLDYKYKSAFCVPYKVRMKKLNARADYSVTGDIEIHGEATHTFTGYTWNIAEPNIANGWFMIGVIPVQYDVKLPIRAGTGDLTLSASGDVGLEKMLDITGHYEYACDKNNCAKVSSSFNDNGTLRMDNIQYQLLASATIEPWAEVAIKGRIYWGLIWAKVGIKPSLPIKLSGYYGNMCGNGDGLSGNETVAAGVLDIDFRAGVVAQVKYFNERYWEIYRTDVYFADLVNPYSTAFSPIIRPSVSNHTVTLPVSLRSCIQSADQGYQDFTVYWGDGSSSSIHNLSGTRTLSHNYSSSGTYQISVRHRNGAATNRSVNVAGVTAVPVVSSFSAVAECSSDGEHPYVQKGSQLDTKRIPRDGMWLSGTVNATNAPTQYEVYMGSSLIYSGSSQHFFRSFNYSPSYVNLKARAKNSVGWSNFRSITVRCNQYLQGDGGII
ncbi:PKD domain-containing protein [Shewanella corallii]|uniref:PKD domain-containing protein n=1 Tax=Shewanella corallii TaxID=560080 RepID=A0ABT0N746_9GAMM|nr:PKD domain-containing protein [Shewanella corallii]MCL2914293.1 PKD domain-containing protein [Shewanella corallii]